MSLAEKLGEIAEKSKERIPEEIRKVMKKATAELRESGITGRAVKKGDTLPPFELPNMQGETVSSRDLLAKGDLVLTFYRGVW